MSDDKYNFWMTILPGVKKPKRGEKVVVPDAIIFELVWFMTQTGHNRIFSNYHAANPVKLGHELFVVERDRKIVVARKADLNTGYIDDLHSRGEHFDGLIDFAVISGNGSKRFDERLILVRAKITRIRRQKVSADKVWDVVGISFRHSDDSFTDEE